MQIVLGTEIFNQELLIWSPFLRQCLFRCTCRISLSLSLSLSIFLVKGRNLCFLKKKWDNNSSKENIRSIVYRRVYKWRKRERPMLLHVKTVCWGKSEGGVEDLDFGVSRCDECDFLRVDFSLLEWSVAEIYGYLFVSVVIKLDSRVKFFWLCAWCICQNHAWYFDR